MTAAEARALTDARKAETWVDQTLRVSVYPKIADKADRGRYEESKVTIMLRPTYSQDWEDAKWAKKVESLADALRAQGYQVMVSRPPTGWDPVTREVRVSW